ncbi:hypothetical protein FOA43_000449 [Brettanomyces nanus]|uniref:SAP domain-containing protein n=1 Tax=Eeniella nana TaxID=13502 RepID=A0A875RX83_EENNA|nr:uncharacterized protein FOA43_000449 [Brettanomyces nanus]QPG73143.1 hypothetical protein FOA43_000449 [Brettanomyces nanus]
MASTTARAKPTNSMNCSSRFSKFFHRTVHSTSKKETILFDLNNGSKSKYGSMNCQGLKMELRRRGLKVSGKKLELIQRLCQADETRMSQGSNANTSSRAFSTTKVSNGRLPMKESKAKRQRTKKAKSIQQVAQFEIRKVSTLHKVPEKQAIASLTRSLSSSSPVEAKDDTSNIDYFRPAKKEAPPVEHLKVPKVEKPEEEIYTKSGTQSFKAPQKPKEPKESKGSKEPKEPGVEPNGSSDTRAATFWGVSGLLTLIWWSGRKRDGRQ